MANNDDQTTGAYTGEGFNPPDFAKCLIFPAKCLILRVFSYYFAANCRLKAIRNNSGEKQKNIVY